MAMAMTMARARVRVRVRNRVGTGTGIMVRLSFTNRGEMVECEAGPMFCRPKFEV